MFWHLEIKEVKINQKRHREGLDCERRENGVIKIENIEGINFVLSDKVEIMIM